MTDIARLGELRSAAQEIDHGLLELMAEAEVEASSEATAERPTPMDWMAWTVEFVKAVPDGEIQVQTIGKIAFQHITALMRQLPDAGAGLAAAFAGIAKWAATTKDRLPPAPWKRWLNTMVKHLEGEQKGHPDSPVTAAEFLDAVSWTIRQAIGHGFMRFDPPRRSRLHFIGCPSGAAVSVQDFFQRLSLMMLEPSGVEFKEFVADNGGDTPWSGPGGER